MVVDERKLILLLGSLTQQQCGYTVVPILHLFHGWSPLLLLLSEFLMGMVVGVLYRGDDWAKAVVDDGETQVVELA